MRGNLLRPLKIRPGMRVLEVGCGTGAITRWLAEHDVAVLAVEGNIQRARAAAVRCSGLANVEVLAGTLDDVASDVKFDAVVVVGVLEYATKYVDADDGPRRFLEGVVSHMAGEGVLVLAIENQLGLKYLLGYEEDHLGLPWVGMEGYSPVPGPRTWSRRVLGDMLSGTGLQGQRWLFPFPDYKLPSVVIDERLYAWPDGAKCIDQLVRRPVTADATSPSLVCDARLAHRQLLLAGIGPEIANSFLVVAGRTADHANAFLGPELAWLFGDARRRQWRRHRAVIAGPDGLHIVDQTESSEARSLGWLRQASEAGVDRPFVQGEPLDLLLFEAIRRHDLERASKLLIAWRSELEAYGQVLQSQGSRHPFAPEAGGLALPEDFLDVSPANFVLSSGSFTFIDREWVASGPVSAGLVEVRALWWLAQELVESGEAHPWGALATVDEVCQALCALAGGEYGPDTLARWRRAEAELQHLVGGGDPSLQAEALGAMAARRSVDVSPRVLPFTALRAGLDAARRDAEAIRRTVSELNARLEESEQRCRELQMEVATARDVQAVNDDLRRRLEESELALAGSRVEATILADRIRDERAHATALEHEINRLKREIKAWSDRMARIERRLPVRLYRKVLHFARRS
jgi:hypothetical protein